MLSSQNLEKGQILHVLTVVLERGLQGALWRGRVAQLRLEDCWSAQNFWTPGVVKFHISQYDVTNRFV